MTLWHTAALGAVAGFTIYLGLPVARLRRWNPTAQSLLNAIALGVILFLIWDILSKAIEPIGNAMKEGLKSGHWGLFGTLVMMLAAGLTAGLVGLVTVDAATLRRAKATLRTPTRLAMMIAVGLGLHNFSEGLAIGQGAAAGAIEFALILVIGFGLHNVTEGFAVAAPLAATGETPSWSFLGLAGLVAGGPTLVGTLVGYRITALPAFVLFLALAAGALFYIVGEMFAVTRRLQTPIWVAWGIAAGFLIAYGTDLILTAGGI